MSLKVVSLDPKAKAKSDVGWTRTQRKSDVPR